MGALLNLRDYQEDAVSSLFHHFGHHSGSPLVVLPTGSGKSLVMAAFIQRVMASAPGVNIMVLAHVKELLEQNYREIKALWADAPAGIYSAGIGRREVFDLHTRIVFAGIQSIWNKAKELQRVDIVIVDEAHMIPRKSSTRYFSFLQDLRFLNSNLCLVGLTATPYRLDSGLLTEGDDALFQRVSYEANVGDLVRQGYLSPLISKRTKMRADLSSVQTRGGEFISGQMAAAMEAGDNNSQAIREIIEQGQERRSWLIFCAGIEHTEHILAGLRARGISAEMVTGTTPSAERRSIIESYKAAKFRALVNCDVLTTGFNAPAVDLIAFLRATQSVSLYVQMAGRGTRNAPGKDDCLVLDFAGNVERHGPIDAITIKGQSKAMEGEVVPPPSKACPECQTILSIASRVCTTCGHEFPAPERADIGHQATSLPIMAMQSSEYQVLFTVANAHVKVGKPMSMKLDYITMERTFHQWICLEHEGFARQKAEAWWRRAGLPGEAPTSVKAAIEILTEARWSPASIRVVYRDKFWDVVSFSMPVLQEAAG
jgi:DNA repair protein RadD